MQYHDPNQASDDAFDDEPTGTWRVIGAVKKPVLESEPPEQQERAPEQARPVRAQRS